MSDTATIQDPSELVEQAGVEPEVIEKSKELLDGFFTDNSYPVQTPSSAASGAYYAARLLHNYSTTQKEVGEEFGVSDGTIRRSYQDILEYVKHGRNPRRPNPDPVKNDHCLRCGSDNAYIRNNRKYCDGCGNYIKVNTDDDPR